MFCAGPRPGAVTPIVSIFESYWRQTLVSLLREITATLHLNLPLGVTNEGREAIKLISGAVAGDSRRYKFASPANRQISGAVVGLLYTKIGELHAIFYLCFLVLLVYLSVFTFVSLIKNTKNIMSSYLLATNA